MRRATELLTAFGMGVALAGLLIGSWWAFAPGAILTALSGFGVVATHEELQG